MDKGPNLMPIPWVSVKHTINDTLLYLQPGVEHGCPMRGSTEHLTQMDAETHSHTVMELGDSWNR